MVADPSIPIEIEDIEAEIKDLQIELAIIESRGNSRSFRAGSTYDPSPEPTPCILVVDDEPDVSKYLSLMLEMAGYQTLTAKDGAEALALLQLHPVDLILSDISMPSLSGYQLPSRPTCRATSTYRRTPCTTMTGNIALMQEALGHQDPKTTRGYTRIKGEQIIDGVRALGKQEKQENGD